MSKDVSFIIPTKSQNRNKDFAGPTVNDLREMMKMTPYSYEIVVFCRDKVEGPDIVWVEEPESNDGACLGFNMAYWASQGDYIFTINDDWHYHPSILKAINFLKSDAFADRKYRVTAIGAPFNFDYSRSAMPSLASPPQFPLSEELKNPKYLLPEHTYAVFGNCVFERKTVENHLDNHLSNPRFKHRYWDNYISFFIGEKGEFPLVCEGTFHSPIPNSPHSVSYCHNDRYDYDVFCELVRDLVTEKNPNYV